MSNTVNAFERAHEIMSGLCSGTIDWMMRIPADEARDPYLVIGKALRLGIRLYALQEQSLEILHKECASLAWVANMDDSETNRVIARRDRESLYTLIRSIRAVMNDIEGVSE